MIENQLFVRFFGWVVSGIMFRAGAVQKNQQYHLQLMPNRKTESHGIGHDNCRLNEHDLVLMHGLQSSLKLTAQFLMRGSCQEIAPIRNRPASELIMVSIDTRVKFLNQH